MKKSTIEIIVMFILCLVGGMSTGILRLYNFEYAHIACIYLVVIWANTIVDKLNLDMDK